MTDEAKKIVDALRQCHCEEGFNCVECPYDLDSADCMKLELNAADLIERMNNEIERLKENLEEEGNLNDQLMRECDAAVHDLGHEFAKTCYTCIHENEDPCTHQVNGRYTNQCFGWQWRGVCAENSGGDAECE